VARHQLLAGDRPAAGAYLMVAAADARALGALHDASTLLREAVDLVDDDRPKQAEAWLALADIEALLGHRREWEEASSRGRDLLTALGDRPALVEAIASRGRWLRTNLCYPRESLAAYREALAMLDTFRLDAPELRAVALAGAAWAESLAGDPARVAELADAFEAIPEAADDVTLALEVASARAGALARAGELAQAVARYVTAANRAIAAGRNDLAVVLWINAATLAAWHGDFERALELSRQAATARAGGPFFDVLVQAGQAHALARLGRHAEAAAAADRELAASARSGTTEYESVAAYDRGSVALAAGDHADAIRHLATALADRASRYFSRPLARLQLAEARLAAGDPAGAERELDAVPAEPVVAADLPDTLVARLVRVEALLAATAGDQPTALRRLAEAETVWRQRLGPDATVGDAYATTLVDLGRPPVAGLTEPAVELGRVLADRAALLSEVGDPTAPQVAAEAAALARATGFRLLIASEA
jgi:tetratricopeptide (TPR) repeat protein